MKIISLFTIILLISIIGIISATENIVQHITFTVGGNTSLNISPTSYDYGDLCRGQCSESNPNGQIILNNTGTTTLNITTNTTGFFENIEYLNGTDWVGANSFSTEVSGKTQINISTRICIPSDADQITYTGIVIFEYIALQ